MKTPLEHFREWKEFTGQHECIKTQCKNCKFDKECEAYEYAEESDFY